MAPLGVSWEQGGGGTWEHHSWVEAVMGSFFLQVTLVAVSAVLLGLSVGHQILKGKYCFFSSRISVNSHGCSQPH